MNYLKSIGIVVISYLLLLLITTILSYCNIINNNILTICKLLVPIISISIGSFYLGKNNTQKGYISGILLGLSIVGLILLINLLFYHNIIIKQIVYYSIFLISSIFSSMLGVTRKKV